MNKTFYVGIIIFLIVVSFFVGYLIKGQGTPSNEIQSLQSQISVLQQGNSNLELQVSQLQEASNLCETDDDCNLAKDEICVLNHCVINNFECKTYLNEIESEPGTVTCAAEPELWLRPETGDCLYKGCGSNLPYGSPGEEWIRVS